jgi:hypothetical protein
MTASSAGERIAAEKTVPACGRLRAMFAQMAALEPLSN